MSITHSPDSIRRQDIPFIIFFFPYPQTSKIFLSSSFSPLSASLSLSLSLYRFKSHLAIQLGHIIRISKLKVFCKPSIVQNMRIIIDAFPVLVLSYSSFMFIISCKYYVFNAHPYTHLHTHTHTHIYI